MKTICAYSSICEEDSIWIDQYLAEAERLNLPFAMNFDRCSQQTKDRLANHPNCIATVSQDRPEVEFTEDAKQAIFNRVVAAGFDIGMAWDVDETYEKDAPAKLEKIREMDFDVLKVRWWNLWNDPSQIRCDGPFSDGNRDKFFFLTGEYHWKFMTAIVNGPIAHTHRGSVHKNNLRWVKDYDFACLHWGMMTPEMRLQHKERWDRIYTRAVGKNPYGFWDYALDEVTYPPQIRENIYL